MQNISLPSDAFSHGQIKSKLWLSKQLANWSAKHMADEIYVLNWYGSWIGLGPFLLLSQTNIKFQEVNLYDLNQESLSISRSLLQYWHLESVLINTIKADVNTIHPTPYARHLFINTSCEHIKESSWLTHLPSGTFVLLQSTDMPHIEHINTSENLSEFIKKYDQHLSVLESDQIEVCYPDKKFSRFMLFGLKR